MVNLRHPFRHATPETTGTPYRLVVYVTGGPADGHLLEMVEKIGYRQNTYITIAYVVEVQQSMPLDAELPAEIERGESVLHEAEVLANRCVGGRRDHIVTALLQARSAGAAIVDEAIESEADAIMLSSSIRKRYGRPIIGDAVEYVLRNAPCEVIVIRREMPNWRPDEVGTR